MGKRRESKDLDVIIRSALAGMAPSSRLSNLQYKFATQNIEDNQSFSNISVDYLNLNHTQTSKD